MEICGFSSLDHLHELDVYTHSLEMLRRLLLDEDTHGILVDVGMPIMHQDLRYNCRVICLDGKILLIRPKMTLTNDGNYRETRHFARWTRPKETELFHLPDTFAKVQGQTQVPFGDAVISTLDTTFGACEELATHLLDGAEIINSSSCSYFTLQKLGTRLQLMREASPKSGGIYLSANQQGCDGERVYFDGGAMIIANGDVLAQGSQFSLNDVEVVTATVNLEDVRSYRTSLSHGRPASTVQYPRIQTPFALKLNDRLGGTMAPTLPIQLRLYSVEEEIAFCGGCYLWDVSKPLAAVQSISLTLGSQYLRRSGSVGYLVCLSGGIDSCSAVGTSKPLFRVVPEPMLTTSF